MKDKLIKALKLTALILSLLNGMIYYSMRPLWSGISKTLGDTDNMSDFAMNAPILLFALFVVIFVLTAVLFFALKKKHGWVYGLLPLHVLLFVALILAFALGAPGYARFILFNLANITGIVLAILVILFFIFLYPKTKLKDSKVFKFSLLGVVVLGVLFFLFNIKANTISYEPVVYAVEDEYQIVFSGNTPSQGWVKIGDMEFYDTYAGSQKSTERVHKITVPQKVLDEAKSYTIYQ